MTSNSEYPFRMDGKGDRADVVEAVARKAEAARKAEEEKVQPGIITASLVVAPQANEENVMHNVNRKAKADALSLSYTTEHKLQRKPAPDTLSTTRPLNNIPRSSEVAATAEQKGSSAVEHRTPKKSPKAVWDDLVKMASIKGGDGEEKPKIFGALSEKEFRARELRCMATAVYFEARDEPMRGQIAVGQVIMTRVRSEMYPMTICGVVYQGQWNKNACQFSFACDGKTDNPKEKKEWKTSLEVARKVIAGKVHLNDISDATHYHATYVHPPWVKLVKRVKRIGRHIFYKASFAPPLVANAEYTKM
jgi:spore germination cell wall hydrolase CwlJ-like protein